MDNLTRQSWEKRADKGDGQFAIAVALLDVAYQLRSLGNGDAASPMGAIEGLAAHLGEKIDGISSALNTIAGELDNSYSLTSAAEKMADAIERAWQTC
jgi:hypothetical protein